MIVYETRNNVTLNPIKLKKCVLEIGLNIYVHDFEWMTCYNERK